MSTIKFKKQLPEITVIEKFSPNVIAFDTKEDFVEYLSEHKEDMDKMTTCKLNKMYHIPNYRITKIKGEISLKKNKEEELPPASVSELYSEIATLKTMFNNLVQQLAQNGVISLSD